MRTATTLLCLVALLASAAAAGKERAQRSVSDLVKALREGDEEARIEAAREISERGITASRVARVLQNLMLTESGGALLAAADALERTGANMKRTVKELTSQLAGPEPAARARAAWALSLIPSADSAASQVAPLVEETDDWVRVNAACALLRWHREAERMAELLVGALEHAEARVRARAIHGLRYVPGESEPVAQVLAKIAAQGGPEGVRACHTLAELGPRARSALPTLRSLLGSSDIQLASVAARAFGSLGPEVVEYVPDLLDRMLIIGPETAVATAALLAMGKAAVPALVRALEKGDTIRKSRAATVLEQLGPEAAPAVPALIRLIPKPRPRSGLPDDLSLMQVTVIRTLGKIGKAARPALPALQALARTRPGEKFQAEAQTAISLIRGAGR